MKAVLLYEYGDASQLRYENTDTPKCNDDEVLVRVRAISLNPIDWKLRSGVLRTYMPLELPTILGRDLAGEVAETGRNVKDFAKGAPVMALANRTYAEYAAVKATDLALIPDSLTFEQAAALPLVTITGTQLIERAIKIQAGQSILVTGALGGVGRTAVHVAHKHGARVLAGVREKEKAEAQKLGADQVVAIDNVTEIDQLRDLDAIADAVGGKTIQALFKAIRKGGVLGSVLGPPEGANKFDIRVQAMSAQPDAPRMQQLADDIAHGEFSIPIARVMKLSEIQEAHRLAERGGLAGKIVLVVA